MVLACFDSETGETKTTRYAGRKPRVIQKITSLYNKNAQTQNNKRKEYEYPFKRK